jgi:hypothetical protein
MTFRKALNPVLCVCACLASQSCVEYLPPDNPPPAPAIQTQENPPPPQPPPPYPAQYSEPIPPPPSPPAYNAPPAQPSPDSSLDALLGPIALYPDPLIAIILPASTVPGDIAAAESYLSQGGDPRWVDSQPWDPSVRALAHYPTVVNWLASNPDWTQALGAAFASSPSDVMNAVQRLRARATAAGTLTTTPQQQVVTEDGAIEIVPADDSVIYVPVYDPAVVYSDEPYYGYGGPYINFGPPCDAGIWLSYSFDWRQHRVWEGDHRPGSWRHPREGDHQPPGAHSWHPSSTVHLPPPGAGRPRGNFAPHPMPGAPNPPPSHYRQPIPPPNHQAPLYDPSAPIQNGGTPPPADRPRLNGTTTPATAVHPMPEEAPVRYYAPVSEAPAQERTPMAPERGPVAPAHASGPDHPPQPAHESQPTHESKPAAQAPRAAPAPQQAPTPDPRAQPR